MVHQAGVAFLFSPLFLSSIESLNKSVTMIHKMAVLLNQLKHPLACLTVPKNCSSLHPNKQWQLYRTEWSTIEGVIGRVLVVSNNKMQETLELKI